MRRVVFLHGFLGCSSDWDAVISFLPDYPCKALDYPFMIEGSDVLVGYSMGGRIALKHPNQKIILSAHTGLTTKEERRLKHLEELNWIQLLKTKPIEEFLERWYEQDLFKNFKKSAAFPRIFQNRHKNNPNLLIEQLKEHALSKQRVYKPKNAFFIYGAEDLKYAALYNHSHPNCIPVERSGHVIHLENPQQCANAIRKCLEALQRL